MSEAGASVYSASAVAAAEFPDLDVSLRGAVSIARRLQDPLAELVRIEPKAIGVGQYQHDVSQVQLAKKLDAIVEDCVNAVGADVNTASVPLLARISGLSEGLAKNIVAFRDEHGPFKSRGKLLKVPRVGDRTYQQAAGFLRIMDGDDPLDASAVHPEAYPVVQKIVAKTGLEVKALIGKTAVLRALKAEDFADAQFGVPTVKDILSELEKPGRDPRPEFKTAAFKEGVNEIAEPSAWHDARRRRHQRRQLRRLRRHRRPPGRPGPRLAVGRSLREGSERRGEGRRHRQRESRRHRSQAEAHRVDDEEARHAGPERANRQKPRERGPRDAARPNRPGGPGGAPSRTPPRPPQPPPSSGTMAAAFAKIRGN